MPRLADLYGIDLNRLGGYRPEYISVMERPLTPLEQEQRSAPIDRPYASGQLETPMLAPDDLIGSGIPTKLASLAKGSIPSIAGIFIGPKHPAWNKEAAELALQMKANSVDPRSIWKTTMTMTDWPGVAAAQEISDKGTQFNPGYRKGGFILETARDAFSHPTLFQGYPDLGDAWTTANRGKKSIGAMLPKGWDAGGGRPAETAAIQVLGPNLANRRSTMLHELQHGVQHDEGWPVGTAPAAVRKAMGPDASIDKVMSRYLSHSGETLARITEARRDMDDAQRRLRHPLDTIPNLKLSDLWSE